MDSDELKRLDESRLVEVDRSALRRIHLATLTGGTGRPTYPPVDSAEVDHPPTGEAPQAGEIVIRRVDRNDRPD
jgi:hypothetical protein